MKKVFLFIISAAFFLFPVMASAAVLYIAPEGDAFNVGGRFTADIKIDSEGVGINAAQATFEYNKDVL